MIEAPSWEEDPGAEGAGGAVRTILTEQEMRELLGLTGTGRPGTEAEY